ncbi:hypothetical protein [Clostridium estertheticum]|nr:hypothetical protein [Clostridium estertheticum]
MGNNEDWQLAESSLQGALEEINMDFKINEGMEHSTGKMLDN